MCDRRGLKLHLDGPRLFNAAIATDVDPRAIASICDSVSVCLSKGLAAPVGSVLCGPGEFITEARRWRKMVGGGMRQAGILAAAGIIALTEMVQRLAEDHANAQRLAEGLADIPGFDVDMDLVQTNMVFVTPKDGLADKFVPFMAKENIIISAMPAPIRLVTHYGIEATDIETVIQIATQCSAKFYLN